jgi:hypothetical protein
MTAAFIVGVFGTVILVLWTGYFILGGTPLLFLRYKVPNDARFVRGFLNVYYVSITAAALVGALGYAGAGRFEFAFGMALVAGLAVVARRLAIQRMDTLRPVISAGDTAAISSFRRIHIGVVVLNLVLFGAVVWSTTKIPI